MFVAHQFRFDEYRHRRTTERDENRHREMMQMSEEMGKFTRHIYRFTIAMFIAACISTFATVINVLLAIKG